jgi:lysophospholipase L1-like esterase
MPRPALVVTLVSAAAAVVTTVALAIPATAQTPVRYVALGDSYSSGLGAGSYDPASGSCDRSASAYPALWASAHAPASFTFAACAGATTSTVVSTQLGALNAATTFVSISIGGNDVGFSSVMETCVLSSTSGCVSAITAAEAKMSASLPGELDTVLGAIARAAPAARVLVLGYPELYDLSRSSTCIGLSTTDRTDLNQAADRLDATVQAAAQRHRDAFGDVRGAFSGHEICDSNRWLHSVNFLDLSESYHPTAAGQADAYYPVLAALES